MLPLKLVVEPIKNGFIVECRGHGADAGRELVHAPDEAGVETAIGEACAAWRAAAEAERAKAAP